MKLKKIISIEMILVVLFLAMSLSLHGESIKSKKQIVFVRDDDGEFFTAVSDQFKFLLREKGWTESNSDFISLSLGGNKDNASKVVSEIVKIDPDVVLINTTLILDIAVKLEPYGIPVVSGGGLEMEDISGKFRFVDKKGYPTTNLTGTFTMPLDHLENTFKLLSQIAPNKDKKVAFATLPSPAFTEKKVKAALNKVGLELKEYREFIYFDDYKDFVLKNNKANDVGWIINGEPIISRKDDREFTREDVYNWENKYKIKPGAGFWELEVQLGVLCALAIDSMTTVSQMLNMADQIIRGQKLSTIKPENPGKTLILVNQKKALQYGLEIPLDLYNISWRIYTDYNGNYIGHE